MSNLHINLFEDHWDEVRYFFPCTKLKDIINHHMINFSLKKDVHVQLLHTINMKTSFSHEDVQFTIKQCVPRFNTNIFYFANTYVPCVFYDSKTLHDKLLCENTKLKIHEPKNIKYLCKL